MPSFTPSSLPNLSGKVYLITGSNTGIGFQSALHLALKNAKVYICARSEAKGFTALKSIRESIPGADIHLLILDHMDLSSIVSAAQDFKRKETKLHGLVNNAGIMAVPFEESKDGYESQWQTNYLAHFLLTYHLLPTLLSTARTSQPGEVRIVNVTSNGHNFAPAAGIEFDDINLRKGGIWNRYGQSKLGNILHAKYLNGLYGPKGERRAEGEIWTSAAHPGSVYTDLNKKVGGSGFMAKAIVPALNCLGVYTPAEEGAYTSVFCAASREFEQSMSGSYIVPVGKGGKPSKKAMNSELAVKLWAWSEQEMRDKGML
jgi:NAD(P)-dependent dehydrogenase (short-subunit alcohol dehydrogenase family)